MKHASIFLVLLAACGSSGEPSVNTTEASADRNKQAIDWPGYYSDTLPCLDCSGMLTDLWVRSDSTFILQERRIGRDSIPMGTVGQWHVVNGLITIGYTGDKPYFFRFKKEGLELVDEMDESDQSSVDYTLDKLAGEHDGYIPRMRLMGTFIYMADAQSFQPCGAKYVWPCVGGIDMSEEEGEPLNSFNNIELQESYRSAVKQGGDPWVVEAICSMSMGPAMEGDGADEYIYVERAPMTIAHCP